MTGETSVVRVQNQAASALFTRADRARGNGSTRRASCASRARCLGWAMFHPSRRPLGVPSHPVVAVVRQPQLCYFVSLRKCRRRSPAADGQQSARRACPVASARGKAPVLVYFRLNTDVTFRWHHCARLVPARVLCGCVGFKTFSVTGQSRTISSLVALAVPLGSLGYDILQFLGAAPRLWEQV